MLVWVIVAANLMAMLVQYLSAKTGIATGKNLPELCREHFKKPVTFGLWLQAEAIAIATDLAEFVGAAIALNLLFGVPPFVAGLMTAVVAFGIVGDPVFAVALLGGSEAVGERADQVAQLGLQLEPC
jgi:manganese transport protein